MEKDIIEFIEENKDFLLSNNIDIAHSYLTDRWYVYRYDTEYHYYDYYIEFSSLQELNNILLELRQLLEHITTSKHGKDSRFFQLMDKLYINYSESK